MLALSRLLLLISSSEWLVSARKQARCGLLRAIVAVLSHLMWTARIEPSLAYKLPMVTMCTRRYDRIVLRVVD